MTELSPDGASRLRPNRGPLPRRRPQDPPGDFGAGLPRRTTTFRRSGRHRSAHRISVSNDAPALVLAIPAPSGPGNRELAEQIALAAAHSCPGAAITTGFLDDGPDGLASLLASAQESSQDTADPESAAGDSGERQRTTGQASAAQELPHAVIVPVLAGPQPTLDARIGEVAASAPIPVMLAAHLGPHPLIAEALHDRLAEAGMARAARARGLNIASGADGVLVVADRGPQAVSDAGVTALLLAARLAVPAAPATLDDQASLDVGLAMLREAGARHPAVAPYVIGPESAMEEFDRLCSAIGAPRAEPLGSHPAVAQLIAIRYGEALSRMALPGS